jgi:MscS family membrane protein
MQEDYWYDWIFEKTWVVNLGLIVFFAFFINIFIKKVLSHIKYKKGLTAQDWRFHLDYVILRPLQLLSWVIAGTLLAEVVVHEFLLQQTLSFFTMLRDLGIVFSLTWLLFRWKKIFYDLLFMKKGKGKHALDFSFLQLIGKLLTLFLMGISALLILQILGLDIVPLVTFGGIGAAMLGFASKDIFSNFFGGLMLNITRPFSLEETVELPHRKIEGVVEEIGWYLTVIRDLQKKPIYVPNAIFSNEVLVNRSRMTHRRIEEVIGLRYLDILSVEGIVTEVRALLFSHEGIDSQLPIYVFVKTFAASSIELEIKAYTVSARYEEFMEVKQNILLQIYAIVEKREAALAFPSLSVHLSAGSTM